MEPIFIIHQKHGDMINMLQEPGLLTEDMVDTWIDDLTILGVWDSVNAARLPVCDYDIKNMTFAGKALLNSCTEGLQLLIKATLKPKEMSGPKVLFTILERFYSPLLGFGVASQSVSQSLVMGGSVMSHARVLSFSLVLASQLTGP